MDVVAVGILGGTFDPIHNGHLGLGRAVRRALGLGKILFAPVGTPPHKPQRAITPSSHRLKMVQLAVAGDPFFEVSTVDLDRPPPHYSVDTVARLRAAHRLKAGECYFIIGADSLADLPGWHAPDRLLQLCRLAVGHRPGYRPPMDTLIARFPGLLRQITWVEMPGIPISATAVRRQVSRQEPFEHYVPPAVAAHIKANGLYRQKKRPDQMSGPVG